MAATFAAAAVGGDDAAEDAAAAAGDDLAAESAGASAGGDLVAVIRITVVITVRPVRGIGGRKQGNRQDDGDDLSGAFHFWPPPL